jgi:hypothetical protein
MLKLNLALSTKGLQGNALPCKNCRGKTLTSSRLDRFGKIVLPLAAFLAQIDD